MLCGEYNVIDVLPLSWFLLCWAGLVLVCHSHSTGSGWWWVRVTSLMMRLQPNWVQGLVTALPQLELSAANQAGGRRSNILQPPPPTTHHHPDTNKQPNIHYSTEDLHHAPCLLIAGGLGIIESCQVLDPPGLSGSFEWWGGDCLSSPTTQDTPSTPTTPTTPTTPSIPPSTSIQDITVLGHFPTNSLSIVTNKSLMNVKLLWGLL